MLSHQCGLLTALRGRRASVLRWLAHLSPGRAVPTGIEPALLARDPEVARVYRDDPWVRRSIPAGFCSSLDAALRLGASFVEGVRAPTLLLHGESDALCPPAMSRRGYALLRGGGHALQIYPQLRHELWQEPEAEDVQADALRWIEERGF